jgi:predicted patatin/cPLA2 family phospholipase
MHFEDKFVEGDLDEVLRALLVKRDLLERNDPRHEEFRIGLAGNGGALCGVYGAGQLSALESFRLTHVPDVAVASSTSAPAFAFAFANDVDRGSTVYWNECLTQEFLSLRRLLPIYAGYAMDIDYLGDVFRGKNTRDILLYVETMRRTRTAFYVVATNSRGELVFFDMRMIYDPIEAIKASSAIPGISRGFVYIDGEAHFDGEGAAPFPAAEMLRRFKLTHLLVLANRPKPATNEPPDPAGSAYLKSLPEGARRAFETRHERFMSDLAFVRAQKECKVAILWTDGLVPPFCRSRAPLEEAWHRSKTYLAARLTACRQPIVA